MTVENLRMIITTEQPPINVTATCKCCGEVICDLDWDDIALKNREFLVDQVHANSVFHRSKTDHSRVSVDVDVGAPPIRKIEGPISVGDS